MGNYFYDMLPSEEIAQLKYIPTVPEFLSWIEEKWADLPAVSDTNVTYTYSQMCSRIARRRAFLEDCGLSKGDKVIGIEILPQMPAFEGRPWEEVEAFFNKLVDDVNAKLPGTHRIRKVVVRREDFKRTGSLKVSRNQN